MKRFAERFDGNLLRDLALLLFLMSLMGMTLLVINAPADAQQEYLLLMGGAFLTAALAFFGRSSLAVALAGLEVCAWTAYKLYSLYVSGTVFLTGDYIWLPVLLVLVGSVCLFHYGSARLERENVLLRSQVEDLVMVDALTGLYNLRALYREIPIQSRYCSRHGLDLSLMLVQLRYENELRSFLPGRRFLELKRRLADLVSDALRVEDRAYVVDENGTLALLLACGDKGCDIVTGRLRALIEDPESFSGIMDDNIMVSIRITYKLCTEEDGKRPIEYKLAVERELQYDV